MDVAANHEGIGQISFGPFQLAVSERLLIREGVSIEIGGRALDLLIALIEQPGRVLSKRELLKRVWPDVVAEDGSLRFHVASLRRLLGDGEHGARYISTHVGVGYAFVGQTDRSTSLPTRIESASTARTSEPWARPVGAGLLPTRPRVIGRSSDLDLIEQRFQKTRLFTIVGAGGVGKTSLAVEYAHRVLASDISEARFVDLAAVEKPALVATTIARALGIAVQGEDAIPVLMAHLRDRDCLIVLDNCEHLIAAVSATVELVCEDAPFVKILATSREPLRAMGEHVYRLGALAYPDRPKDLDLEQLQDFPAVELFIERASASNAALELDVGDVRIIAEICQRLDGMALPIELVAMRVASHGISATHALLGERFSLSWSGRRTVSARQQTLQATLDWSYELLTPLEQTIFARLSVFVGFFSMEAASQIASGSDADGMRVATILDDLVLKGLVSLSRQPTGNNYRLLEMTRAYASTKLHHDEADLTRVSSRHASFCLEVLTREPAIEKRSPGVGALSTQLGNIRSALDWSFGPNGEPAIGASLAVAAAPLFLSLSLLVECRTWCARAIEVLDDDLKGSLTELELQAALAHASMFTKGNVDAVETALRRALEIAVSINEPWNRLRLLGQLQIFHERVGDFRTSMAWAQQAVAIARDLDQPDALAIGTSLAGISHHLLGQQDHAREELEASLRHSLPSERRQTLRFGFDHRNRSGIGLARTLWLKGFADQARAQVARTLAEAAGLEHPVTQCIALIWSLSVYIWTGDREQAEECLEAFSALAEANNLQPYVAAARGYEGVLLAQAGESAPAIAMLEEALADLRELRYALLDTSFEIALAEAYVRAGRRQDALELLARSIARGEADGDAFALPELLRIKAMALAVGEPAPEEKVEPVLSAALALAKEQGARGWELRNSIDLARVWISGGKLQQAAALLSPLRQSLTEGRNTMDGRALEEIWAAAALS